MEDLKELTVGIVYAAIDELNEQLSDGQRLLKSPSTVLLGPGGKLDSIGLVNLMALLEEKCEQRCGKAISLFDDTGSAETNPFQNVDSLTRHLASRLGKTLSPKI